MAYEHSDRIWLVWVAVLSQALVAWHASEMRVREVQYLNERIRRLEWDVRHIRIELDETCDDDDEAPPKEVKRALPSHTVSWR